jgi:hypothetical protein
MDFNFEFKTKEQEEFFFSKARNNCFSGGFGNGKTFIGCVRQFVMLASFPGYKSVIGRELYADLRDTTMKTFFKICPDDFIASHNVQAGYTLLKNGSSVNWKHFDEFNEQASRGLEVNSAMLDQAEEVKESCFYILDSRIGRWDQAIVPKNIKAQYYAKTGDEWPKDTRGKDAVPNFFDLLVNPDTTYHWVYKKFHPDSSIRDHDYFWVHSPTVDFLNDPKTIQQMLKRDPEWIAKYYKGEWGTSNAQIHYLDNMSLIDLNAEQAHEFLNEIRSKATLYRSFDHGEVSPSCCLWAAFYKGSYIFYREYYAPNLVISDHRRNISDLSIGEGYSGNYSDPSMFKKNAQKSGGFWSVADEYVTADIPAPPIYWEPADNNEFATRNRINELLFKSDSYRHPISGKTPAPGIYFIKKSPEHNLGCYNAYEQLLAQRRQKLGDEGGRAVFSDERDKIVVDHAYDAIRYFVAMHSRGYVKERKIVPPRSFKAFDRYDILRRVTRPLSQQKQDNWRSWNRGDRFAN